MIKITFYKDKRGDYRWRIAHQNGNIIAASSEGYKNLSEAEYNLEFITSINYKNEIS